MREDLEITLLGPETGAAYAALFDSAPEHLLYASPGHLAYLRGLLPGTEERTLLALRGGEALGALPCLVRRHAELGVVMNSLPYYGSNAGLMLRPGAPEGVADALLGAWEDLARQLDAAAWTMVENPLAPQGRSMDKAGIHTLCDRRMGQLTPLAGVRPECAAADLMVMFHQKTRNMVRKSLKSGLRFESDESRRGLETLHALHRENLEAMGGLAKPAEAFTSIPRYFQPGRDYRLYLAREAGGEAVAGLLVFFCNRAAEYYTPAVKASHRHLQPISGLAFGAMQEAVARGMLWWNWGGTWLSQDGVYRFKSRWGAQDRPYAYYITVRDARLFRQSPERLREAFPHFYVRPFAASPSPDRKTGERGRGENV